MSCVLCMCAHTGLQLPASLLTAKVNSRGWWVISNFRRCSHICSFPECLHSLKPSALSRLFFCTLAPTTKCPQKVFYCGKPCLSLTLPLRLLVTESLFFFFFFFNSAPVSLSLCFSPGIGRIVSKLAFCFLCVCLPAFNCKHRL